MLARDPGTPPPPKNSGSHFRIYLDPDRRRRAAASPVRRCAKPRLVSARRRDRLRGMGPAGNGSSGSTGASHGPFSTRRRDPGTGAADMVTGRNARRVRRGLVGTGALDAIPRSTSPTRTEATFTSSRGMRTTNMGSPGRRDGRWILYGRANREGIYVIGADGRNNHRLTRDSPTPVLVSGSVVGARRALHRLRRQTEPGTATST